MFPTYNPYSALVYCANTSNVDVVMTGGEIRVRGGRLTRTDLPGLRAQLSTQMKPFMESAAQYADII
jgi:cytosine/adenosine deaminase-related metal-dependent hydrolase